MNPEILHDAIGQLPEELLAPAQRLRRRRPLIGIVSLAACLCLVIGLGFLSMGGIAAGNKASPESGRADNSLAPEAAGPGIYNSEEDLLVSLQPGKAAFRATVTEVHNGYLIVSPLEGESEALSGERFFVGIPETAVDVFQVGDTVEIHYSGRLLEVSPVIPDGVTHIILITP